MVSNLLQGLLTFSICAALGVGSVVALVTVPQYFAPGMLILLAAAVYLAPAAIAYNREHTNRVAIFVFNLFLGWTLLGWVIALVWAVAARRATVQAV